MTTLRCASTPRPGSRGPGWYGWRRGFAGAWPYLELIAAASKITDALDARVVEAYWVGNSLLDNVRIPDYGAFLDERFRGRAGRGWEHIAGAVPAGAVPHHSFHVFLAYPWSGLLREGRTEPSLQVLDSCRISWGRVIGPAGRGHGACPAATAVLGRPRAQLRPCRPASGRHRVRHRAAARGLGEHALELRLRPAQPASAARAMPVFRSPPAASGHHVRRLTSGRGRPTQREDHRNDSDDGNAGTDRDVWRRAAAHRPLRGRPGRLAA